MNLIIVVLMGQPAQQGGIPYASFLMLLLIIVVFYFFMIRPQMKRQKELRKFRESLQKGDKVVTTGGIYGKIDTIKETYFVIEIDNNVRVKIDKSAVLKDSSDIQS